MSVPARNLFDYEVSFDLVPRNGEFCLWIQKYHHISTLGPGPEPGKELKFELRGKFRVGRSKVGVLGHTYPEIKGQCFFENGEWRNLLF